MAKRWEYIIKSYRGSNKEIQQGVNRQGEGGWELISIYSDHKTPPQNSFVFKRELTKSKK